jgi:hypothetical protein
MPQARSGLWPFLSDSMQPIRLAELDVSFVLPWATKFRLTVELTGRAQSIGRIM